MLTTAKFINSNAIGLGDLKIAFDIALMMRAYKENTDDKNIYMYIYNCMGKRDIVSETKYGFRYKYFSDIEDKYDSVGEFLLEIIKEHTEYVENMGYANCYNNKSSAFSSGCANCKYCKNPSSEVLADIERVLPVIETDMIDILYKHSCGYSYYRLAVSTDLISKSFRKQYISKNKEVAMNNESVNIETNADNALIRFKERTDYSIQPNKDCKYIDVQGIIGNFMKYFYSKYDNHRIEITGTRTSAGRDDSTLNSADLHITDIGIKDISSCSDKINVLFEECYKLDEAILKPLNGDVKSIQGSVIEWYFSELENIKVVTSLASSYNAYLSISGDVKTSGDNMTKRIEETYNFLSQIYGKYKSGEKSDTSMKLIEEVCGNYGRAIKRSGVNEYKFLSNIIENDDNVRDMLKENNIKSFGSDFIKIKRETHEDIELLYTVFELLDSVSKMMRNNDWNMADLMKYYLQYIKNTKGMYRVNLMTSPLRGEYCKQSVGFIEEKIETEENLDKVSSIIKGLSTMSVSRDEFNWLKCSEYNTKNNFNNVNKYLNTVQSKVAACDTLFSEDLKLINFSVGINYLFQLSMATIYDSSLKTQGFVSISELIDGEYLKNGRKIYDYTLAYNKNANDYSRLASCAVTGRTIALLLLLCNEAKELAGLIKLRDSRSTSMISHFGEFLESIYKSGDKNYKEDLLFKSTTISREMDEGSLYYRLGYHYLEYWTRILEINDIPIKDKETELIVFKRDSVIYRIAYAMIMPFRMRFNISDAYSETLCNIEDKARFRSLFKSFEDSNSKIYKDMALLPLKIRSFLNNIRGEGIYSLLGLQSKGYNTKDGCNYLDSLFESFVKYVSSLSENAVINLNANSSADSVPATADFMSIALKKSNAGPGYSFVRYNPNNPRRAYVNDYRFNWEYLDSNKFGKEEIRSVTRRAFETDPKININTYVYGMNGDAYNELCNSILFDASDFSLASTNYPLGSRGIKEVEFVRSLKDWCTLYIRNDRNKVVLNHNDLILKSNGVMIGMRQLSKFIEPISMLTADPKNIIATNEKKDGKNIRKRFEALYISFLSSINMTSLYSECEDISKLQGLIFNTTQNKVLDNLETNLKNICKVATCYNNTSNYRLFMPKLEGYLDEGHEDEIKLNRKKHYIIKQYQGIQCFEKYMDVAQKINTVEFLKRELKSYIKSEMKEYVPVLTVRKDLDDTSCVAWYRENKKYVADISDGYLLAINYVSDIAIALKDVDQILKVVNDILDDRKIDSSFAEVVKDMLIEYTPDFFDSTIAEGLIKDFFKNNECDEDTNCLLQKEDTPICCKRANNESGEYQYRYLLACGVVLLLSFNKYGERTSVSMQCLKDIKKSEYGTYRLLVSDKEDEEDRNDLYSYMDGEDD